MLLNIRMYALELRKLSHVHPTFVRGVVALHLVDGVTVPFDTLRTILDIWTPAPDPWAELDGSVKRITKEAARLLSDPPTGCTAWPADPEFSMSEWVATLQGIAGTPYEGGVFRLKMTLPRCYPMAPPIITFITKVYHPNVSRDGVICHDVLGDRWSPALSLSSVLLSIHALLGNPNSRETLEWDIAEQYRLDKATFEKTAREWTAKYAKE